MKRTHLPLNALRVFDAAARHLSFTRAADELAVTPAAVGQQIRALEDMLGVVLFRRTSKGLELTDEAQRRARTVARRLPPVRGSGPGDAGGPVEPRLHHRRAARFLRRCGSRRGWPRSARRTRSALCRWSAARTPTSPRPTSTSRCAGPRARAISRACCWPGRAGHRRRGRLDRLAGRSGPGRRRGRRGARRR